MTVSSPPRAPTAPRLDPEALFAEARHHRRQRRIRLAAVSIAVAAAGAGLYWGLAGAPARGNAAASGATAAAGRPDKVVILLVDVSGSMAANDLKPTRLQAAVDAMRTFLARLPSQVKVGLVAFSVTPQVVVLPTLDRARLRAGLATLTPVSGTALGDALEAAVKLTRTTLSRLGVGRGPTGFEPATIVLESDGGQNRGSIMPLAAANAARAAGIRVDGITVGTKTGSVPFGAGAYQTKVPVPPDPHAVAAIASMTAGKAYAAASAGRLTTIYRFLASSL